jgi:tetratricopeptide (TPR) repeat protein
MKSISKSIYFSVILVIVICSPVSSKTSICYPSKDTSMIYFIKSNLKKSLKANSTDSDSSLFYARKAYQASLEIGNDTLLATACLRIAAAFDLQGNPKQALDYYFKAYPVIVKKVKTLPGIESSKKMVVLLNNIASCYFNLQMNKLAMQYFDKTNAFIEAQVRINPHLIDEYTRLAITYNMSSMYIKMKQYDDAQKSIEKATLINQIVKDSVVQAGLMVNKGVLLVEKGLPDKAMPLYMQALPLRERLGDCRSIVALYNNIGNYYQIKGDHYQALKWFEKVLIKGRECSAYQSMKIAFKALSGIYVSMGDYKKAFEINEKYNKLEDSIFNVQKLTDLSRLAYQYEFEEHIKVAQLSKDKDLAELKSKRFLYVLFAVIFCLLFLLISLLYLILLNKRRKDKFIRLQVEYEKQKLEIKQINLENELLVKNKELAANALYLGQKSEIINEIAGKINTLSNDLQDTNYSQRVKQILNDLQLANSEKVWEEFEIRFKDVHLDFYTRINEIFPNLTSNEKKLCAFLRLNMSTKEIAAITFQTPLSIKIARSRLRKKMGLTQGINLIAYLENV